MYSDSTSTFRRHPTLTLITTAQSTTPLGPRREAVELRATVTSLEPGPMLESLLLSVGLSFSALRSTFWREVRFGNTRTHRSSSSFVSQPCGTSCFPQDPTGWIL